MVFCCISVLLQILLESHKTGEENCILDILCSKVAEVASLFLLQVAYLPLSVMITTFRKENVKRPLEGFGVLVPSLEQQNGLRTIGNICPVFQITENLHYSSKQAPNSSLQVHSFPP